MTSMLKGQGVPRSDLTERDVQEMYLLFQEFYDATTRDLFQRDLDAKNWIIVVRDEISNSIQGFTTLDLYASEVDGQPVGVVYSGDTILRPAFWGSGVMPSTWIKTVLRVGEQLPKPLYWLLISSGYKTYRLLTSFYKEFYPRHDCPTPPGVQATIDQLASERFGSEYRPDLGIVRFSQSATPLRQGVARLSDEHLKDPHTAFFAQRNPGHARGDELVCLAEVSFDNLTAAGRYMCR